jgi:DNA-binding NtrC family response regulator
MESKDVILIVDEDAAMRAKMRVVLEEDQYDVMECNDCWEADQLVRDHKIELVLVNIDKACDDGIDAIEKIRKDYPNLPLVVTSHAV